jgi:hypothetical protein
MRHIAARDEELWTWQPTQHVMVSAPLLARAEAQRRGCSA